MKLTREMKRAITIKAATEAINSCVGVLAIDAIQEKSKIAASNPSDWALKTAYEFGEQLQGNNAESELIALLRDALPAVMCATDGLRYTGGHELEAKIRSVLMKAKS